VSRSQKARTPPPSGAGERLKRRAGGILQNSNLVAGSIRQAYGRETPTKNQHYKTKTARKKNETPLPCRNGRSYDWIYTTMALHHVQKRGQGGTRFPQRKKISQDTPAEPPRKHQKKNGGTNFHNSTKKTEQDKKTTPSP